MESYPDVMNCERKTLVTSPPQFQYSAQMKDTSTVLDEEALEQIIKDKKYKDEADLKDIKHFRAMYLPQAGERDTFNPMLTCFFFGIYFINKIIF